MTTSPLLGTPFSNHRPVSLAPQIASPRSFAAPTRASTPEARGRAKDLVAATDRLLLEATDAQRSARVALLEYRAAMRLAQDDADIEIRQAMLLEALGKGRDADRAIERASRIDRRLTEHVAGVSPEAGGFLAEPPEGVPAIAVRGFQILEQISQPTAPSDQSPSHADSRSAIAWLSEAWERRWGITRESPMLHARAMGESDAWQMDKADRAARQAEKP
jgi:hypothetical protein